MSRPTDPLKGSLAPVDPESLEVRLREAARRMLPEALMDDLELRHLARVMTECSLLLTDVYSDDRIRRIMDPTSGLLSSLVDRWIEQHRESEDQVLRRIRRLPDEVRRVGDKALFDLGLVGLRQVKGFDLTELGSRAYRQAGQVLELLAEDRRLREFFKQNRLLMLPLEEEVVFLHQCSDRFAVYAELLRGANESAGDEPQGRLAELVSRVPLMAAAAEALADQSAEAAPAVPDPRTAGDPYLEAARGEPPAEALLSREELLSTYERILLFSALDLQRLRNALKATVIDQEEAVEALCDDFSLFASGTRDLRKPPAYFLVGPTGVGKNHLVECLCRTLEGIWKVAVPMLTIEGPSYTDPSDINELKGATRGFIRSDEEGLLATFHEKSCRAPFSVILVDEVEKAHPQLRRFFLPVLDRGVVTDNRGQSLNFSNCAVFFTSNLGYSEARRRSAPIGYMDQHARDSVADRDTRQELRRALPPEFMNRVRVIHFNRLGKASAEQILDLEFGRIARRYLEVHGLNIELAPSAREELIERGFSPAFGARRLAATLESVCNVELARRIRTDDRRGMRDWRELVAWLREIRSGKRAFRPEETRRRVLDSARASLEYRTMRIVFENGSFDYLPGRAGEAS